MRLKHDQLLSVGVTDLDWDDLLLKARVGSRIFEVRNGNRFGEDRLCDKGGWRLVTTAGRRTV